MRLFAAIAVAVYAILQFALSFLLVKNGTGPFLLFLPSVVLLILAWGLARKQAWTFSLAAAAVQLGLFSVPQK